MDTLLAELKENSSILCNSLTDPDFLKPHSTAPNPWLSQPADFFNFSELNAYEQTLAKNFDQAPNIPTHQKAFQNILKPRYSIDERPLERELKLQQSYDNNLNSLHYSFSQGAAISKEKSPKSVSQKRNTPLFQSSLFPNNLEVDAKKPNDSSNWFSSESFDAKSHNRGEELLFEAFNCNAFKPKPVPFGKVRDACELGFKKHNSKNLSIQECISVTQQVINFGTHLPGRILEESLEITNTSNKSLSVEVVAYCFNSELQNTKEYVYSIRSNYTYDYSETRQFSVAPNSTASFKVALKVPGIKQKTEIKGEVRIASKGLEGDYKIFLKAQSIFPRIFCPKQLFSNFLKSHVVNVAVSRDKPQERKIVLRNTAETPVILELSFYNSLSKPKDTGFECSVYPKILTISPNTTGIATVLLKPSKERNIQPKAFKEILVGKAQDSSLVYSFILWIETFCSLMGILIWFIPVYCCIYLSVYLRAAAKIM